MSEKNNKNEFNLQNNNKIMANEDFLIFLRLLSKKGFFETLLYINVNPQIHYSEIQRHVLKEKIVTSQASVTIILNGLTNLGLVTRTLIDERPPRTSYSLNKFGKNVLLKLNNLKKSLEQ